MIPRRSALSIVLALTVMLVAACGSDEPTATSTPSATTVNVTLDEWSVVPSPTSVRAGTTTFAANNDGTLEHELIVLQTQLAPDALVTASGKVDESQSGTLIGEIEPGELQPGQSASASWDLSAGAYVLFCNIPGHYAAGMRTGFTVN